MCQFREPAGEISGGWFNALDLQKAVTAHSLQNFNTFLSSAAGASTIIKPNLSKMETYNILKFSPSKVRSTAAASSPAHRSKQPSPEKFALPCVTVLASPKRTVSTTKSSSPAKTKGEADLSLGK